MNLAGVILISVLLPMSLSAEETKEQAFWKWFEQNQEDLHHFEKDQEAVFNRLAKALHNVHQNLTFEFSAVREDGKREFVISAGGIKAAFPSVESLYAAAPKLPKWTIVKFRQRHLPLHDVGFRGRTVKSDDVHYAFFKDENPTKVGIMVFLDGYAEQEKDSVLAHIGFLFLDQALGEYDVETHVGAIVFSNRESEHFRHAHPFSELPAHFDERLGRKKDSER